MWENISFKKCESFLTLHFYLKNKSNAYIRPTITISRQEGAGGHTVASNLADYLKNKSYSHEEWTIFDKNLVERVIEEYRHQKNVADFMGEAHKSMITDAFEELIGLHPSTWKFIEQTNMTISKIAQKGNVIIVGRGANIITKDFENVFHVRLVGSFHKRVKQVQKVYNLNEKEAIDYVRKEDEGRKRYLKDNFGCDIDDPLLYHLVINTDSIAFDEATKLIGDAVIHRFKLDKPEKTVFKKEPLFKGIEARQ
ncbi:MAG TPA: cytidylate kinase-like family protein [Syntrophorhabdaceae bacterium]|nr:cytidylate kinase-like family protein [Syntrophorhabdaceae bacterium]